MILMFDEPERITEEAVCSASIASNCQSIFMEGLRKIRERWVVHLLMLCLCTSPKQGRSGNARAKLQEGNVTA
jgi:hypothetical protein